VLDLTEAFCRAGQRLTELTRLGDRVSFRHGSALDIPFEDASFDVGVQVGVVSTIAERAVRIFPLLGQLNVVRTWAAQRVMSRDGFPIYEQSANAPGAFVATCHSGVTLAANHALALAPHIAAGRLPDEFAVFSARRFDVPQAA
jgi:glycine/D-amino acid oxidase-like deaminating enzyme